MTYRYLYDDKASRGVLSKLFTLFKVLDTAGTDCLQAIPSVISDYEDAVMVETAVRTEADCIVKRNLRDDARSSVPTYAPDDFLRKLDALGSE